MSQEVLEISGTITQKNTARKRKNKQEQKTKETRDVVSNTKPLGCTGLVLFSWI